MDKGVIMDDESKKVMLNEIGKFIGQHLIKEADIQEMINLLPDFVADKELKKKMWTIIHNSMSSAQAIGQMQVVYAQSTGEQLPIFDNIAAMGELAKHNLDKTIKEIDGKKEYIKKIKIPDNKEDR